MKVTYYGHSCFSVELNGKHLLFDPFISGNPAAKHIEINKIRADYILVSHGHDDHVDDAITIARHQRSTLIAAFEVSEWLKGRGAASVASLNHGGAAAFDFGRLKVVGAVHSSSLPDGSYGGNAAGFVVESSAGNFYYSGDTALTYDMKLIGESTKLDWAALCIGDYFTMGVEDALRAAEFINCRQIMGVHYDTFPPIKIDHARALDKFSQAGRTLHLLKIGETRDL